MKRFQFKGDGAGIPGLPHVISQAEIDQFSVEQAQIFQGALESGAYVEVVEETLAPERKRSASSAGEPARIVKSKKSDASDDAIPDEGV
jgi:hypothetical protein